LREFRRGSVNEGERYGWLDWSIDIIPYGFKTYKIEIVVLQSIFQVFLEPQPVSIDDSLDWMFIPHWGFMMIRFRFGLFRLLGLGVKFPVGWYVNKGKDKSDFDPKKILEEN